MIKASELCQVTEGSAICPYDDFFIKSISTDTRKIKKGDVFFALKGEHFDGHDFCEQARQNGASILVVEKLPSPFPENIVVVKVKDTLKAYQELAVYYRMQFNIPVIAVTGSTGKTTTKDIIAAALGSSMKVLKSYANFNNEIGVPATLFQLNSSYQAVVLEMGMRGLGQIKELAQIARPTIGVVTNVGKTHIELLQSVENIAKAKQELIDELPEKSTAILNCDDKYVEQMASAAKGEVIFYGFSDKAQIRAENARQEEKGIVFTCLDSINNNSYEVFVPVLGMHNVYNTLCAISVATVLGIEKDAVLAGLQNVEFSAMRQNIEQIYGMTFVDDTYNANPDSMRAALELLSNLPGKRKIAVLGDMLELGEIANEEHAELGRIVSETGVNVLITVGSKSYHTSAKAAELGVRTWHFATHKLALETIVPLISEGDTILFKASRGIHMDELLKYVKEQLAEREQKNLNGNPEK